MDITVVGLRGWREALGRDIAVPTEKRQEFSRIIEKYLVSSERHGWAVAVESMNNYIELAVAQKSLQLSRDCGRRGREAA